jgi:hypothetical protein
MKISSKNIEKNKSYIPLRTVALPFSGFYDSRWGDISDREYEGLAEDWHAKIANNPLDISEYIALIWGHVDWQRERSHIAEQYTRHIQATVSHEIKHEIQLYYEALDSPKYYNFETDRIFAKISNCDAVKLLEFSKTKDNHETLRSIVLARFSHRSGFHSFYSNCVDVWLEKPIEHWDLNELSTLISVALRNDPDYEADINEHMSCNGTAGAGFKYAECRAALAKALRDARQKQKIDA